MGIKKLLSMLANRLSDSHVIYIGDSGMDTHAIIRVNDEGLRHKHLVGRTNYGKGHLPAGGHKTDVVFETAGTQNVSPER